MSVRDQLKRLVELQVAELDLRRVDSELAGIPATRVEAEARVQAAKERVTVSEADHEASLKHRRQLEGQLQDAEAQLDKYREHELQVKTNEQLWALQGEMKQAQKVIGTLEEGILEEMESADALEAAIETRRGEQQEAERETRDVLAQLDAQQLELDAEREAALAGIVSLTDDIDPELVSVYERVKTVRQGVAVAEAIDGMCRACHVRLRPQLYLQVLNLEKPMQCDNCKRILFSRDALQLPSTVQIAVD